MIAGVTSSLAIFNGVYPAVSQSSSSIMQATVTASDRIESRVAIIQVGNSAFAAEAWIKNIGTSEVNDVGKLDVFFGPIDDFYRVNNGGQSTPYWEYNLEGGATRWGQATTLHLTIHPTEALSPGIYMLKIVLANGISDQTTFGVE